MARTAHAERELSFTGSELASLRDAVVAFQTKAADVMIEQLPLLRTILGLTSWYSA